MRIELPEDVIERVERRKAAGDGVTEIDVIRRALDSLDWQDRERAALAEGLAAWRSGDTQDFAQFDAEFRERNSIAAEGQ